MQRTGKKLSCAVRVFAVAALAVAASPVPADGGLGAPGEWVQHRTPQGCLVYYHYYHVGHMTLAQYYEMTRVEYRGTGCVPGEPVNGDGEIFVYDDAGRLRVAMRGHVTNGVIEGHGEKAYSLKDGYFPQDYVRGCEIEFIEEGGCIPFAGKAYGIEEETAPAPVAAESPASSSPSPLIPATPVAPPASGNVWGTCVVLEDPRPSGIEMIYAFRNSCTKAITVSFCMKATYESAGDWNLCSQRSHKAYDIGAGQRFEFPFTPATVGSAMSDGRTVDRQEVRASGAACIGATPSVHLEGGKLVFEHC